MFTEEMKSLDERIYKRACGMRHFDTPGGFCQSGCNTHNISTNAHLIPVGMYV